MVEKRVNLTHTDQLFLLGDYINRGTNSAGVLDYIMELTNKGFHVFPLRGNHEQKLLDAWHAYVKVKNTPDVISFSSLLKGSFDLLNDLGELQQKYVQFLEQLPYYYELDNFYLVHAGFDFQSKNPFLEYSRKILIRNLQLNPTLKIIIHGHQNKQLDEIKQKVKARSHIIPLDNGCYKRLSFRNVIRNALLRRKIGNLCCLNLDTFELIVQKNID